MSSYRVAYVGVGFADSERFATDLYWLRILRRAVLHLADTQQCLMEKKKHPPIFLISGCC